MVRQYEVMYVLDPDGGDEKTSGTMKWIESMVEKAGGRVEKTVAWGRRRLAYEIEKKQYGHYVIVRMEMESGRIRDLERQLHLREDVMRHLVVVGNSVSDVEQDEENMVVVKNMETGEREKEDVSTRGGVEEESVPVAVGEEE